MHLIIGEEVDVPVASLSGEIRSERVVVTNEKVLGKKIRHLGIHQKYGVVISRLIVQVWNWCQQPIPPFNSVTYCTWLVKPTFSTKPFQ